MIARCGKESGGPTLVAVVVGLLLGFGVGLPSASAAPTTADFDHVCSYDQSVLECASTPDRANAGPAGMPLLLTTNALGDREWATLRSDDARFATKAAHIDPADIAGKTPAESDAIARGKGLIPKGPDPTSGKGAYTDPVTGQQRVLCHTSACPPHAHVNNPAGQRLDIDGNVVPPESPEAHLPLGGQR